MSLAGVESFAAVSDSAPLTISVVDGATLNAFSDAANYNDFFREISDGAFVSPVAGGFVTYNRAAVSSATALYDTSVADGAATIDRFGGGTSTETYSIDVRVASAGSGAGIYARVPGAGSGGYHLSLRVENGAEQFVIWKNASVGSPGTTDVNLFQYAVPANVDFATINTWYTLVFTLRTNAAGNAVTLDGKVFTQGQTDGAPLAEFGGTDSISPLTEPGQSGFRLINGSGANGNIDMDNFSADVSVTVDAGANAVLNASHYLTSLVVNGAASFTAGGDKLLGPV